MKEIENIKYWNQPVEELFKEFESNENGLSDEEAKQRLEMFGENSIKGQQKATPLKLLVRQINNPTMIILLIATLISAATGSFADSSIILAIIVASVLLSFFQEYNASNAIEELRASIQMKTYLIRAGQTKEINATKIVPGDIILLSAGSLIPADAVILESVDLLVNQAALTGESLPSDKKVGVVSVGTPLAQRINCLFMGTHVQSGRATALVVKTGEGTEFGQIAEHLEHAQPKTEFEKGIQAFGYLITKMMLLLTVAIFFINLFFHRPVLDSLLFSVALSVGLTPQLLPAIISITLSKGSKIMASEGVIVRKLAAIENLGSMDVLCTDKTGTLTEGTVQLLDTVTIEKEYSAEVFHYAYLNAHLQTGMVNPLDQAILASQVIDVSQVSKLAEIPYDFKRKRLSVIIHENDQTWLITKGAFNHVFEVCSYVQIGSTNQPLDDSLRQKIIARYSDWGKEGIRVLGLAKKLVSQQKEYTAQDETELTLMGFLLFFDPPKADVQQTIAQLSENGVDLRIITGDNQFVARHTAEAVGLPIQQVLTGADFMKLSQAEFVQTVEQTTVFAEVDPQQKEKIILALMKNNHVVGYMGDGINDVPALHSADIGISVDSAVDVAKESADFVLIEKSLTSLNRGIELGRTTFGNTMKYIAITISANFGNMFSMAGASIFMAFLPLLPKQILLINFLTDFPALTLSHDSVDKEVLQKPKKWDIHFIRNYMIIFGLISSCFDYLTFGVLLLAFRANETLFHSSWFVLSVMTELVILLIMRTQKPFFKSKPAPILIYSTIGVAIVTMLLTILPFNRFFGLAKIPAKVLFPLLGIVVLYVFVSEIAKYFFYHQKR